MMQQSWSSAELPDIKKNIMGTSDIYVEGRWSYKWAGLNRTELSLEVAFSTAQGQLIQNYANSSSNQAQIIKLEFFRVYDMKTRALTLQTEPDSFLLKNCGGPIQIWRARLKAHQKDFLVVWLGSIVMGAHWCSPNRGLASRPWLSVVGPEW